MCRYQQLLFLFACFTSFAKSAKEGTSDNIILKQEFKEEASNNNWLRKEHEPNTRQSIDFFNEDFAPERQTKIELLTSLRDEIQNETWNQKIGSDIYYKMGILGKVAAISAPFTAGSSLFFYGSLSVLVSNIADSYHRDTTARIVKQKLTLAEQSLFEHAKTTLKMYLYLNSDITEKTWLQNHLKNMRKISPRDIHKDEEIILITLFAVLPNMSPLDIETLIQEKSFLRPLIEKIKSFKDTISQSPTTMKLLENCAGKISFIFDFISLCNELRKYKINKNSLEDFEKGRWCFEANKINEIINKMESEYKTIRKVCLKNIP